MQLPIKIHPADALKALKILYPLDYIEKIEVCKAEILRKQKTHQKPFQYLFDKFFEVFIQNHHHFVVLVAFQEITNESNHNWVVGEIKRLQEESDQVKTQLQNLDLIVSSLKERADLRQYYQNLLLKNEQRIGKLATCLEVVDPEFILPGPDLFYQYAQSN